MNASEITFGIEIETTIPCGSVSVGGYSTGLPVPGLPEGWTAKYDGSIRTGSRRRIGCEFVSPVLSGADGLRQIVEVCRTLQALGARVNRTTGLHVHAGFPADDRKAIERLTTLVANFEQAIYASTGTHSREYGRWCQSVQSVGSAEDHIRHQADQHHGSSSRYRILNLVNLLNGTRPAVEFRAFAGTLNAKKIIAHVRTCLGLVERALTAKRITNWAAKPTASTSPIFRKGGAGQTALTRLFYQLGWIKGRQPHTHGNVTDDDLPSIRDSKRTLIDLAKKYDRS